HRPTEVWRYFVDCTGGPAVKSVGLQARLLHQLDLRPMLPQIRQPILLLCGEQDRIVGRRFEETLLEGLPNAGRVTLEGCGHAPSYTHPEIVAEVVRQFFTPPSAHGCAPAACTHGTAPTQAQ